MHDPDEEYKSIGIEDIDEDIVWGIDRRTRWKIGIDEVRSGWEAEILYNTIGTVSEEDSEWIDQKGSQYLDHEHSSTHEWEEFIRRDEKIDDGYGK